MGMIWNKSGVGGVQDPSIQSVRASGASKTGSVTASQVPETKIEKNKAYSPADFLKNCTSSELKNRVQTELGRVPEKYQNNPKVISMGFDGKLNITIATGTFGAEAKKQMVENAEQDHGKYKSYLVDDLQKDLKGTSQTFANEFIDFTEGSDEAKLLLVKGTKDPYSSQTRANFVPLEKVNERGAKNNENLSDGLRITADFNKNNEIRRAETFPGTANIHWSGDTITLDSDPKKGVPKTAGEPEIELDKDTIRLKELFDYDKDTLKPSAKKLISTLVKLYKTDVISRSDLESLVFRASVEGEQDYNKDLSVRRGASFVKELDQEIEKEMGKEKKLNLKADTVGQGEKQHNDLKTKLSQQMSPAGKEALEEYSEHGKKSLGFNKDDKDIKGFDTWAQNKSGLTPKDKESLRYFHIEGQKNRSGEIKLSSWSTGTLAGLKEKYGKVDEMVAKGQIDPKTGDLFKKGIEAQMEKAIELMARK